MCTRGSWATARSTTPAAAGRTSLRRQDAEIEHWRAALSDLIANDPWTVWLVANNHFMGFAPETARVVAEALGVLAPQIERASRREGQKGLGDFG